MSTFRMAPMASVHGRSTGRWETVLHVVRVQVVTLTGGWHSEGVKTGKVVCNLAMVCGDALRSESVQGSGV